MALTLTQEIAHYADKGFIVLSETATSAALRKAKRFNLLVFLLGLLACGIPGLLYLAWYAAQRDEQLYLFVAEDGRVRRRGGKRTLGSWMLRRAQGRA